MPELPSWMWKALPAVFVVGIVLAANGWLGPLSTLVPVLLVFMLLRRMKGGTRFAPVERPVEPRVVRPQETAPTPWAGVPRARHGITAPDLLSGDGDTAPGSVPEGWYPTADGSRERWHNGATWTAHERMPGSG